MKPYVDLKIEGEHSTDKPDLEGAFYRWADLTNNFFIYLENNPQALDFPVTRGCLHYISVKITDDVNHNVYRVVESDLANLDLVFGNVIKFLKYWNYDGTIKHLFIKDLVWSHMFHPTAFCPIPGILMKFSDVREGNV